MGINNTSPSSSLDITASSVSSPVSTDGILIPRVNEFPSGVDGDQNGMLVFITGSGTPSEGFYWYDHSGPDWIPVVKKIDDLTDGKSEVYDGTADEGPSVFLGSGTGANDHGTNNMNVGIGFNSMNSITTGANNIAIGYNSSNAITTNFGNIAIGSNTLENNTGKHNVAIGTNVLNANIGGKNNMAIGNNSLVSNTTGNLNTAVGPFTMQDNLTGKNNIAFGSFALADLTQGDGHVAIGPYALRFLQGVATVGVANTAVGSQSLAQLITGTGNTSIGHQSLQYGTLQDDNTAIGHFAGFHAGRDDAINPNVGNTFIGKNAGFAVSGDNNVYIGKNAGGHGSQSDYSTGSDNVFIGYEAGKNSTNNDQSDKLIIQNTDDATHLIHGNFSDSGTGKLGVNWPSGTDLPSTLSVNGKVEATAFIDSDITDVPANTSADGEIGEIRIVYNTGDSRYYIYVKVANTSWKKVKIN